MYDAPRSVRPVRAVEPRTRPTAAGWLALVIWAGLASLAVLGAFGVVSVFARMTQGLPPVTNFDQLSFSQQSIIYDRTGKVELARFGGVQRTVVPFDQIPPILIDAQTAVEDKTFWDNAGFDPLAIVSAGIDSLRGNSRGASTITQQLVRQRLLPQALVQDPSKTFERKVKEIIQSIRLTEAYPGVDGKQKIIAAYLNQNYYGDQAYGVKAAAKAYFGIDDLFKLTPAQAAILAGLPQSPSNYDLVRNAVEQCVQPSPSDTDTTCAAGKGTQLVVPPDARVVVRRNQILDLLAAGRTPLSGSQYSPAQLEAAKNDPVVLTSQATPHWIAPHFVWAVQAELADKLCGPDVPTCDQLEAGGLTITTTLDARLQSIAEKWVEAAAVVPNSGDPVAVAKALQLPGGYAQWMKNLRGKDVHNGAMVAIDYQTGELVAYVGSASYYSTHGSPQFQPKFDVVGSGFRQPGSAFKPFNYLTAIDDRTLTAGTMLMDTSTDFGGKYTPGDADLLERGPVRVRNALQFSLNIPAVKAAVINTPDHVFARAKDFGMVFQTDKATAGASIALGVEEVRPVDLVTAYATLANGGKKLGHTTILSVKNSGGEDVVPPYVPPAGDQVASPQAAFVVTDILAGNTNPHVNPFWGKFEVTGPGNKHRPATLKTGTNTDAKDLNAYGYIAPPTDSQRTAGQYALAVGAWVGNSDNTVVSTPDKPVFSIDVTTYMWQGFMQEATSKWAIDDFAAPDGLVQAKIDPFTGLQPSPGGQSITEWFLKGTEPTTSVAPGSCGEDVLKMSQIYESKFPTWLSADADWIARAERGPGVTGGVNHSPTAYFYNGQFRPFGASWGPIVTGHGCAAPSPSVTCYPVPTPDASGNVPSFVIPSADPSA
ncbi:MAG TPA: transglycosylase domain-containing protein, partial [Candidatus Limnocylindrales bacterium]|nr:transglycosylase domain-containing protein [Candidatus Limnocylindrales bacterium]